MTVEVTWSSVSFLVNFKAIYERAKNICSLYSFFFFLVNAWLLPPVDQLTSFSVFFSFFSFRFITPRLFQFNLVTSIFFRHLPYHDICRPSTLAIVCSWPQRPTCCSFLPFLMQVLTASAFLLVNPSAYFALERRHCLTFPSVLLWQMEFYHCSHPGNHNQPFFLSSFYCFISSIWLAIFWLYTGVCVYANMCVRIRCLSKLIFMRVSFGVLHPFPP